MGIGGINFSPILLFKVLLIINLYKIYEDLKLAADIKNYILSNYNQVELFSKYLNIDIEDIEYCLEDKINKISNPLRNDEHPSLGFMFYSSGKLIMKDWADSDFTGDIFHLVGILLKKDSNNSRDFIYICRSIIKNNIISIPSKLKEVRQTNNTAVIRYSTRPFTLFDIEYWNKLNVNQAHLKFRKVFVAKYLWVNNMNEPAYVYLDSKNPMFVYILGNKDGKDYIKTYSPFNTNRNFKFINNSNSIFEAPSELYRADTLIITKSRKDKLLLEANLIDYDNITTIDRVMRYKKSLSHSLKLLVTHKEPQMRYCVTNFMSESVRIKPSLINGLSNFYQNIIVNVDFDKEGITNAFYHNICYDLKCVFLGNDKCNEIFSNNEKIRILRKIHKIVGDNKILYSSMIDSFIEEHSKVVYNDKDFSDYFNSNGIEKGQNLVRKLF